MKDSFWKKIKKPIYALAPMANVTDAAFRQIIAKYGKPDLMYTEFVSCDGLLSDGRESLLLDLKFTEAERPIIAQFFTCQPENMQACARLAAELGFDGIDINMGCPDRSIERQGAGAALIKTPKLARELIQAAKDGAGGLPVSVKTRLGYNKDILDEWLPEVLKAEPAAVILHARTRKEMSAVAAHWNRVADAVKIRNDLKSETLILGNGDVKDLDEAVAKIKETGCDGVMIGRGIFGNPRLFSRERDYREVGLEEKLAVMLEHTFLYEQMFSRPGGQAGKKSFDVMKKHYKAYVTGFDGAKELRVKLMECKTAAEASKLVMPYLPARNALASEAGGIRHPDWIPARGPE